MNNLAVLYTNHLQKYKEAEQYFLLAIKSNKDYYAAMNNLGFLYLYKVKNIKLAE